MVRYLVLLNFTEQGMKNIGETLNRSEVTISSKLLRFGRIRGLSDAGKAVAQ